MRELTIKQKTLLKKWFKESEPTKKEEMLFNKINPLRNFEDLTTEQINTLEGINDTEVLYQNVNYFLNELRQEVLK